MSIGGLEEDVLLMISAQSDVIHRTGRVNAKWPSHSYLSRESKAER
jgi:hypothetical protein